MKAGATDNIDEATLSEFASRCVNLLQSNKSNSVEGDTVASLGILFELAEEEVIIMTDTGMKGMSQLGRATRCIRDLSPDEKDVIQNR